MVAPEPRTPGASEAVDFGPNDWLIEEMYDKYRADPSSVDPSWRDYFDKHGAGTPEGTSPAPAAAKKKPAPAPAASPNTAGPAPAPKAEGAPTPSQAPQPSTRRKPTVEKPHEVKEARPTKPGTSGGVPADPPNPSVRPETSPDTTENKVLKGPALRTAKNMDLSLSIPTATSVRSLPVKLVIDQRVVINNHLKRARGGKVSYTHLIGYAMVKALAKVPAMNNGYAEVDGKPNLVIPEHVNLGLAIDMAKPDGTRQLLVPNIKACEDLDFAQFWAAYEDVVRRARNNKLTLDDFAGTTITLTNPGTIGTNHSVARLMNGQGAIIGVGSMDYPPEFQGSDPERLSEMSVSKVMTLTSTYDHRIIQGAVSGEFLAVLHRILLGEDGFYDEIFRALRIPYEPIRWATDTTDHHENQ
ncbi:MAG TPA: 2-oxo acid dehydrogenase subunit E2, partial [Candidatus Avipropionibacterium avicola]|nr:2-oxo acid dehydrogenase subunit E2 [Candidatus Avipropionibacterium avicola]